MLKPSPSYQHLETAADVDQMKPVLQAELSRVRGKPVHIQQLDIPRVLPSNNGRLLIQYQFSMPEQSTGHVDSSGVLFGHLFAPEETMPDSIDSRNVISLPELRLQIPIFPFDAELPALQHIFQSGTRSDLLPSSLNQVGERAASILGAVQTLAYRPERRAVLRVKVAHDDLTDSLVVKIAKFSRVESLLVRLQTLEQAGFHSSANDGITVPNPIAGSPDGLLWQEDITDSSLYASKIYWGATILYRVAEPLPKP